MGKGKEIKEYMEELQNSKNEVEISKESARDQLLDNVAIVDPQRLSRLYFAVADDRNLFVDVLKQRIEDNIDAIRNSKGKAIGFEEKCRLTTNLDLIDLAINNHFFDPETINVNKNVREHEAVDNYKSLVDVLSDMADVFSDMEDVESIEKIDEIVDNTTYEMAEKAILEGEYDLAEDLAENLSDRERDELADLREQVENNPIEPEEGIVDQFLDFIAPMEPRDRMENVARIATAGQRARDFVANMGEFVETVTMAAEAMEPLVM